MNDYIKLCVYIKNVPVLLLSYKLDGYTNGEGGDDKNNLPCIILLETDFILLYRWCVVQTGSRSEWKMTLHWNAE